MLLFHLVMLGTSRVPLAEDLQDFAGERRCRMLGWSWDWFCRWLIVVHVFGVIEQETREGERVAGVLFVAGRAGHGLWELVGLGQVATAAAAVGQRVEEVVAVPSVGIVTVRLVVVRGDAGRDRRRLRHVVHVVVEDFVVDELEGRCEVAVLVAAIARRRVLFVDLREKLRVKVVGGFVVRLVI